MNELSVHEYVRPSGDQRVNQLIEEDLGAVHLRDDFGEVWNFDPVEQVFRDGGARDDELEILHRVGFLLIDFGQDFEAGDEDFGVRLHVELQSDQAVVDAHVVFGQQQSGHELSEDDLLGRVEETESDEPDHLREDLLDAQDFFARYVLDRSLQESHRDDCLREIMEVSCEPT